MKLTLLFLAAAAAFGQTFDAVSIRPQPWTNEGSVDVYVRGNTLYGEHTDLYRLIDFAYDLPVEGYRLSGGPAWAKHGILSNASGFEETLFHVVAKMPEGPPPSVAGFRRALQAVLADRFQLRVHHEQKNLPVYNLVVAKEGSKLVENRSGAEEAVSGADGPPFRIRAVHAPIARLVEELSSPNHGVGRPMIDKTGLAGFYDLEIRWSPDDLASSDGGASVFTAVEKLGLKLESGSAPYDTVVIDRAAKPTEN